MASVATRTPAGEVEVMALAPDVPSTATKPAAAAKMMVGQFWKAMEAQIKARQQA